MILWITDRVGDGPILPIILWDKAKQYQWVITDRFRVTDLTSVICKEIKKQRHASPKNKVANNNTFPFDFQYHMKMYLNCNYKIKTWNNQKGLAKRSPGESRESIVHRRRSTQVRESTLTLKPRADVTRSPEQWYHWPHKKGWSAPKFFLKKIWHTHCANYQPPAPVLSMIRGLRLVFVR